MSAAIKVTRLFKTSKYCNLINIGNNFIMQVRKEHISVCICTYKRPEMLKKLLTNIVCQNTDKSFSYSIVVVDNDGAQSAKNVIESIKKTTNIEIAYHCEPEQNISLARNMTVRNATGNYIAFIDDDECLDNHWLLTLYKACNELDADGIQGPVIPVYEEGTPEWVVKGKFYVRDDYARGHILKWREGMTGNLLFRHALVESEQEPFRREYGSGGEDKDFFKRMINKGYIFKYCPEAIVYEHIPITRCNRLFMLKRALLRGKMAAVDSSFYDVGTLISIVAIIIYTVMLPILSILGHHLFMKYLIKVFDHFGKLLALSHVNVIKEKYVIE